MNREIKNHLQYKWWAYLLTAVIIIGLWLVIFSSFSAPSANEKIAITFVGQNFDDAKLEADLPEIIRNNSTQKIKKASAESVYSENLYTLDTLIVTRAQGTTDIFIWEGELTDGLSDRYAPLNEKIISSALGEVIYHREEQTAYAIKLDGENFKKYYGGNNECWLLFSINSVNFGGANGKGRPENDAALKIVKYLLEG